MKLLIKCLSILFVVMTAIFLLKDHETVKKKEIIIDERCSLYIINLGGWVKNKYLVCSDAKVFGEKK